MARFNVGDKVIMSRFDKVQQFLIDGDYEAEDYFYDRDLCFVTAINDDGSVHKYAYATYYGVNDDGDEYEYDEPQPDYDDERRWIASDNPEWDWYTMDMLKAIKTNSYENNKIDIICRKVIQLYHKHNNNSSGFKWSNI